MHRVKNIKFINAQQAKQVLLLQLDCMMGQWGIMLICFVTIISQYTEWKM